MKQISTLQKTPANVGYRIQEAPRPDDGSTSSNVSLIGSDQEFAQLNVQLGDLRESLDKAERRIERLMGERSQLKALLDRRDEQIQRLNREVGTYQSSRASTATESDRRFSLSWRDLLASFIGRLSGTSENVRDQIESDAASSPTSEESEQDQAVETSFGRPPLIANYRKVSPQSVLAVVAFGMDENELRSLLPVIERDSAEANMMPLILTDNDAFEILRERSMIFEYLPPAEDRQRFSRKLNWDLYIQRRLSIIRKKWQPARVVALGQVASQTLRLWRDSPFEVVPLPAAGRS